MPAVQVAIALKKAYDELDEAGFIVDFQKLRLAIEALIRQFFSFHMCCKTCTSRTFEVLYILLARQDCRSRANSHEL